MSANARNAREELPGTPLLTPYRIRRLLGLPQLQVAALAECAVASVRLFEIEPGAIRDNDLRRRLERAYATLRDRLIAPAH